MQKAVRNQPRDKRVAAAFARAAEICDEDVETNRKIGEHGLGIIQAHADKKGGETVNILTHCNAGWLACVDWGTALAPIYRAHDEGIKVHVWVDETRPRNQGASLTAFELGAHGVPHTLIADNAGGHLMQKKLVDLCIVGTDRTTADRRRRQQDRHLSEGARRARQPHPVLRGAALFDHRLEFDRRRHHSHRGAGRGGSHPHDRQPAGRQRRQCRDRAARDATPPITASMSRRRGSSPASSPSGAWRRRRRRARDALSRAPQGGRGLTISGAAHETRLHPLRPACARPRRSIDFYRSYCGLEIVKEHGEGDGRVVWLASPGEEGDFVLVLLGGGPEREQDKDDMTHYGFGVASARTSTRSPRAGGRTASCIGSRATMPRRPAISARSGIRPAISSSSATASPSARIGAKRLAAS